MVVKYDSLDLALLSELRENSKQSVRQLAKKLGTHPNTVMQRIKNLEKEDVIQKYSTKINFRKIGYDLHTLIHIKVDKETRADWNVLEGIKKMPLIVACYAITGEYDLFAVARARDRAELTDLVRSLNSKEFIIQTRTELILEAIKYESEFNPLKGWSHKKR